MTFEERFPLCYFFNLGDREDRRILSENEFLMNNLAVVRIPAIHRDWIRHRRGYMSDGRYGLALSQRLAVRKAKQQGAEAVLLFEDDVVLCRGFRKRLAALDIPDDWGLFYLGCAHLSPPEFISPGVVRCTNAIDTHALAISAPHFDDVLKTLYSPRDAPPDSVAASDRLLAELQRRIPSYAAYPNLAWQRQNHSDLLEREASNYDETGNQRFGRDKLRGLAARNLGATPFTNTTSALGRGHPRECEPVKVAFLFLTRGELNHPNLWDHYFRGQEDHFSTYAHVKESGELRSELLRNSMLPEPVDTEWGSISLVRATRLLLKAASEDRSNTHFLLCSESCIPVRPLGELIRLLSLDSRSWIHQTSFLTALHDAPQKTSRARVVPLIPKADLVFHSQWMLLARDAADAVLRVDITSHFERMFAPDECYFATTLSATGFPLQERVRNQSPHWFRWSSAQNEHPDEIDCITPELRGEWLAGPYFFARKVPVRTDVDSMFEAVRTDW